MFKRTMAMKKPMTTEDLFNCINNELKENGLIPSIVDYAIPCSGTNVYRISDSEFDVAYFLEYGANEGAYMKMWALGNIGNKDIGADKFLLGTYKTLNTDIDSLKALGNLGAEFMDRATSYVWKTNPKAFTWNGYSVFAFGENSEDAPSLAWRYKFEDSKKQALELLAKDLGYKECRIVDMATREVVETLKKGE